MVTPSWTSSSVFRNSPVSTSVFGSFQAPYHSRFPLSSICTGPLPVPNPVSVNLCLAHQLDHLSEVSLLAGTLDFEGYGSFSVYRPADDLKAGTLFDWEAFTGTYNLLQPDLAARLLGRKVANIRRLGADVVAAGNIGCMTQIGGALDIPVVHTVELLDWSLKNHTMRDSSIVKTGSPEKREKARSKDSPAFSEFIVFLNCRLLMVSGPISSKSERLKPSVTPKRAS